jgi:nicotinamidase-related amidase
MPTSRELLPRSTAPGDAPPDWRARWNVPLTWPTAPKSKTRRPAPLDLTNAALVIIDIDKKAMDVGIQELRRADKRAGNALARRLYGAVLPNLIRLLRMFRAQRRPVLFVQWGWHRYQYPPLDPLPGEEVIVKRGRGAFGTSGLDAALRQKGVRTLLVAGADLTLCVASTVRGAVDHGYAVALAEDACLCRAGPRMHAMMLRTLGAGTARIVTTRQALTAERRSRQPPAR